MKPKKIKSPDRNQLRELIASLGGASSLNRILLSFYEKMQKDLMIGYFFENKNLSEIAEKQGLFIQLAAGLLQDYPGKGPATAHTEMPPIYSGHFDRRLVILRQVLAQEGLTPPQIEIWANFEESFRAVVVSKD